MPRVGFQGGAFSYERCTPVIQWRGLHAEALELVGEGGSTAVWTVLIRQLIVWTVLIR